MVIILNNDDVGFLLIENKHFIRLLNKVDEVCYIFEILIN